MFYIPNENSLNSRKKQIDTGRVHFPLLTNNNSRKKPLMQKPFTLQGGTGNSCELSIHHSC